jgi:hypothetical protein
VAREVTSADQKTKVAAECTFYEMSVWLLREFFVTIRVIVSLHGSRKRAYVGNDWSLHRRPVRKCYKALHIG